MSYQTKSRVIPAVVFSYVVSGLAFSAEPEWNPRLTEFGQPNLQGVWTSISQTPLERSEELGTKKTYTAGEAQVLQQDALLEIKEITAPIDPDRLAPELGVEVGQGAEDVYSDHVSELIQINGEYRTSVIVDPENGRLPLRGNARELDYYGKLLAAGFDGFEGPEIRDPGERCLSEYGALPPMLEHPVIPNIQFVQTADFVLIYIEAGAELRTIHLNRGHKETVNGVYRGDSIGHWEGNSLVVHTNNFRPEQSAPFFLMSEQFEVTERFTPVSDNEIHYSFTAKDEVIYSAPFTGETVFNRMPKGARLFDYSCHEGNYSLPGALAGARRAEWDESMDRK